MPRGYTGRILRVDLTSREVTTEELPENIYRTYVGCSGLAARYLLKEMDPGADPLGPDNVLAIMTSPICGTPISGANRYTVAAKSPLTNGYGESEAGGFWGPELKAAGFDGIVIRGQANSPVYLYVTDGQAELRDASKFWGQLSGEVQDGIVKECGGSGLRILQTGVAGENLVRYAALVNECRHFHGRSGLGAVMGSKRLKAIAVKGSEKLEMNDRDRAIELLSWFKEHYERKSDALHLYGTARGVPVLSSQGILPTRNFRHGSSDEAVNIGGETMADTILSGRGTCYSCAVACKREVRVPEMEVDPKYGGPEYETVAATGSLLGNFNLKRVALANQLLSQYVLDSISAGAVIAFAMECFEEGLLTLEDTGGICLRFGNESAVTELIPMIARREGLGDLLAEGVKRASEHIGPESEPFALHVKGQEFPMHEPRGKKSLAIAYATSPTGADHMEAPHDPFFEQLGSDDNVFSAVGLDEPVEMLDFGPRKVMAFYKAQKVWSLYNTIGMCKFVGSPLGKLELEKLAEFYSAVTGWDVELPELFEAAERTETMFRLFNYREGMTREDDTLPQRMFEPIEGGALDGEKIEQAEFDEALRLYYQLEGWDPDTGAPTSEKIEELGLGWAV